MKNLRVSIIVPTLNEESTIGELIESIRADPCPKEIIVVDGGSTDGTVEIARSEGAIVIPERGEKCPGNARNIGAGSASSDVLCFLDGDVERIGKRFLSKALKHFESNDVAGVRCEREIIKDSLVEKIICSLRSLGPIKFLKERESRKFKHANFLRKKIFNDVGGFPLLGFGEDRIFWSELRKYVNESGERIVYEPRSIFFQHMPRSFREVFDESEWYGRTALSYLRRRFDLMEALSTFAPLAYVLSAVMIFFIPLHPIFLVLSIPFLARIALAVAGGFRLKSKYSLLIPVLDLVRGGGFAKGLLKRIFAGEKLGRS